MARQPLEPPDYFARLVAAAIRREMGDRRMSGRALARRLGKSEKYARDRLNGTFEFTLNDIERFTLYIGDNPEAFIARIERAELEPVAGVPVVIEAKTLGEVLGDVVPEDDAAALDELEQLTSEGARERDFDLAALGEGDQPRAANVPAVDEQDQGHPADGGEQQDETDDEDDNDEDPAR